MPGKGTRTNNSMSEHLQQMLQDVAYAQALPDADLDFLTTMQAQILAKLRQPLEQAMQQAQAASGPPPMGSAAPPPDAGMGSMSGMPPGGMPPGMGAPELPPGLRNGGSIPNPDELRRLVGA